MAFIIDVFAKRIVGWRVNSSMRADFVPDALEQALHARQPERDSWATTPKTGSQYVGIRYIGRLAEADIEQSVDSRGDSYDNSLAETIKRNARPTHPPSSDPENEGGSGARNA